MNENVFGTYLRKQRKERGLTIRDLEAMSGVSNAHLSYMETGKRRPPSPETLQKLAGPLGVTYEELMAKAGHLSEGEVSDGTRASKTTREGVDESATVPVFEQLVPGIPLDENKPAYWLPKPEELYLEDVFYTRVPDNGLVAMGLKKGTRVLVVQRPPKSGDVCVCSTKTQLLVRRMFYSGGVCVLQGMGKDWAPVICTPEEVDVLGVVLQGEVSVD